MKLTITHDIHGNIQALVAYPADAPPVHMTTEPGDLVTQVDTADLDLSLDLNNSHGEIRSQLADIREKYTVEAETNTSRLIKKQDN